MRVRRIFVVAALATSACATHAGTVRTRAANDFRCPEPQVAVVDIGGNAYRATGCGRQANYTCQTNPRASWDITCSREAEPTAGR